MNIRLYGVISAIHNDNEFVLAEPIFVNTEDSKELYRINEVGKVDKIDVKALEEPVVLPASKNRIDDGRKYLILFKINQDDTIFSKKQYYIVPSYEVDDKERKIRDFKRIFVGIKFPDRFVCAISETMTPDELQTYLSDN